MKRLTRNFALLILIILLSQNAQAQSTSESDIPPFHFPLEVGNVWVYRTTDFPNNCIPSERCAHFRMEVIEKTQTGGGTCVVLHNRRFYRDYVTNESIHDWEAMFGLCQVGNQIYSYRNFTDMNGEFLDRDMIADFDRSETQPWLIEHFTLENHPFPFKLRRLVERGEGRPIGRVGRIDYKFETYLAETEHSTEGIYGDEFVESPQETFMSGVGFPTYLDGLLQGYAVAGVVTGDTTTVWTTSIDRHPEELIDEGPALTSVYPNPFNPFSVIRYQITGAHGGTPVRVFVVDLLGREIAVLFDGMQAPGAHSATFDATHLPSGVYVVVLRSGDTTDRRMVTLVK
jgi:hypothetical protein